MRGRVGKKGAIYLPKKVLELLNLKEGDKTRYVVEGGRLVVERVPNPFELPECFAETTFEEFERESEEVQRELLGED